MKIKELLAEGLIKLPSRILDEMTKFTVKSYLTFFLNWIDEELVGKEYHDAKDLLEKTRKRYGVDEITEADQVKVEKNKIMKLVVEIDPDDLPQEYIQKLIPRVYENSADFMRNLPHTKITLYVDFSAQQSNTRGQYNSATNSIMLYVQSNHLGEINLTHPSLREICLKEKLPNMLGTLNHELTHAVQFMVLKQFHMKQVDYHDEGKGVKDLEAYVLSDVEFDPAIKSGVAIFNTIAKKMKSLDPNWDESEAMRFFTCLDGSREPTQAEIEKIGFTKRANFFKILRKRAPKKFKKAVKLFYQEVNRS